MNRYRAAWLLPIAEPPIEDGWVSLENGRVVALGGGQCAGDVHDLGRVALLPGLVNAHTHLELSYLHQRVPAASEFVSWIRGVVSSRRMQPDPRGADILAGIDAAIVQALEAGTALVGDISNTLVPVDALRRSGLAGVVFHELLRFNAPDPERLVADACRLLDGAGATADVRVSLAAHAPYSVAPSLFRAIRAAVDARGSAPASVHLAESPAETQFIASGAGPWRAFLDDVGAWDPSWQPPATSPVRYLDDLGFLDDRTLVVHGVQMNAADLALVRQRGCTLVTCPRSNIHTGAGVPPIAAFYASGVHVAVGTDSLASTADLSVFNELAALRRIAPDVPARTLLDSATRQGARALGFDAEYGTIEAGKRARLLAVAIPPEVADVEEYLVGGIDPVALRWVDEAG